MDEAGVFGLVVFLDELLMLVALVIGGLHLSIVAAVVLPLAVIGIWGRWLAPRAAHRLPKGPSFVLKISLFSAATLALAFAGAARWAVGFWIVSMAIHAQLWRQTA